MTMLGVIRCCDPRNTKIEHLSENDLSVVTPRIILWDYIKTFKIETYETFYLQIQDRNLNFALFSSYNDCYERIECDFSALTQMSAGPVILTLLLSDVRWASLLPPPSQSVFTNNILTNTAAPLITSLDDQS